MACPQCVGLERQFDDGVARRELARFRRRGPTRSTRLLLDGLEESAPSSGTFLDIGGGIGAIQHSLMTGGAGGGTHVDASSAYLAVSRSYAADRGWADHINYVEGDFVEVAPGLPSADLVTLDRVVCCYPDMPGLLDAAADRCRGALGVVFPRQSALARLGARVINLVQRMRGHPFRVFIHTTESIEATLARHGLRAHFRASTFIWHVVVYARAEEPLGPSAPVDASQTSAG